VPGACCAELARVRALICRAGVSIDRRWVSLQGCVTFMVVPLIGTSYRVSIRGVMNWVFGLSNYAYRSSLLVELG